MESLSIKESVFDLSRKEYQQMRFQLSLVLKFTTLLTSENNLEKEYVLSEKIVIINEIMDGEIKELNFGACFLPTNYIDFVSDYISTINDTEKILYRS